MSAKKTRGTLGPGHHVGERTPTAGPGKRKPERQTTSTSRPGKAKKPLVMSAVEFAAILEVDRVTVWSWMKEGLPVLHRRGGAKGSHVIDLVAGIRWVRAHDKSVTQELLAQARSTPELDAIRQRKLSADARLAEANAAEREGELVPAAEVEPRWARMVTAMRERILSLPAVAVQRAIVAPEHEAVLTELAHDALSELAVHGAEVPA